MSCDESLAAPPGDVASPAAARLSAAARGFAPKESKHFCKDLAYSCIFSGTTGRKHKKTKDLILVVKTCKSYRHSLRLKSVTLLQRSISETFTIGVQKHAKSTSHGSVRTCRQCHEWYASAATKMHDGCFAFLRLAESVTTNKALPCHESRKSHANHSMAVAAISLLRKQSGRDRHPTHSIAKHQNTGTTWDHREATK